MSLVDILEFTENTWGSLQRDIGFVTTGHTKHRSPDGHPAFGVVDAGNLTFWQLVLEFADRHRHCRHCGALFGPTGRRAANGDAYCCDTCAPKHPRSMAV